MNIPFELESHLLIIGLFTKELITESAPYASNSKNPHYIQDAILQRRIAKGILPKKPDNLDGTKEWLWQTLCVPCWIILPEGRLSARKAVEKLAEGDDMDGEFHSKESAEIRRSAQESSGILLTFIVFSALLVFIFTPAPQWAESSIHYMSSFFG